MSLRGLPDWHHPYGAGAAYAAFEQPGRWFAPPVRLDPSAAGGLVVDRYAQDRADGIIRYGVLTLRWDTVVDSSAALAAVGAQSGSALVQPVPIDGGVVRLTGPAVLLGPSTGAAAGVPALGGSAALDQAGMATFLATVTLDDPSTELVITSQQQGLPLIGADVTLVARGVAARHRATAEVDLARLAARLLDEATDEILEVEVLRRLLVADLAAAGITFVSDGPADEPDLADAVAALADRILARFAAPLAPAATRPEDVTLGARLPALVRLGFVEVAGRLRWNLSEPQIAPRLFALASSGIGAAGVQPVVRDHQPPVLGSGWHHLQISTTVRPPWAGATLGCEITIPPAPPSRPQGVRQSLVFTGQGEVTADLRLAPREALSGTVTGFVIDDLGEQVVGTPMPLIHEAMVLHTDAFAAQFLPLELSTSMAQDSVSVQWLPGPDADARLARSSSRMGGAEPSQVTMIVADQASSAQAMLLVTAVDRDGRTATAPPTPARPLLIDAFLFDGTGAQDVAVQVDFTGSTAPGADLEFVAEDADPTAPARLHVARQRPPTTWTRFVSSPFATGFRWRFGGSPTWSDLLHTQDLLIHPTPPRPEPPMPDHPEDLRTAGLRLIPASTAEWQFLPESPSIGTQPGGSPALSLVEAGPQTLLTLVGQLAADEQQLDQARAAVAAQVGQPPPAITLRPAPLVNVQATLLLVADGTEAELARSSTSGAYPFDAAFHVALTPDQSAAVRDALAGGRGVLTLRYTGTLLGADIAAPKVWSLHSSSSSSSTTTITRTSSSETGDSGGSTHTATTGSGHSDSEERHDLPTITPPEPVTLDLDAADWTS